MSAYYLLDILREGQIATIQLKRIEKHLREKVDNGKGGGAQRAAARCMAYADATMVTNVAQSQPGASSADGSNRSPWRHLGVGFVDG